MKVNSNSTCSCGQNKNLFVRVGALEVINALVSILGGCLAIYPAVLVAPYSKHVIKNVQKPRHLRKYQNLASFTEKTRNQVIKNSELHGNVNNVVPIDKRRARLNFVKQVRVVADFLELHEDVQQLNAVF
jgi:hypothetical protein